MPTLKVPGRLCQRIHAEGTAPGLRIRLARRDPIEFAEFAFATSPGAQ